MRSRYGRNLAMLFALTAPAWPQSATSPETQMGAALHQERVTGNLQAAIDGYKKVLAAKGVSRSLAAQAQYHIGVCYEKLGNQEARKAFENVLRNYGDQKDLATQARSRLAAMSVPAGDGIRTRLLWDNAIDLWGKVSADGRHFSFVDWSSCDLAVRDLTTGQNRRLTDIGGCTKAQAEAEASTISRDGTRIAFSLQRWSRKPSAYELRVVGLDGKGEKLLVPGGEFEYIAPYSWSPDGKWIVAGVIGGEGARKKPWLAVVASETGQIRRLPIKGDVEVSNAEFSPDGKWIAYSVDGALRIRPSNGTESPEATLQVEAAMMGWAPDGTGVLFSRVRGDVRDLYLLRVSEGAPVGMPSLIPTTSDIGSPSGVTTNGTLFYSTENRRAESAVLEWKGDSPPAPTAIAPLAGTGSVWWLLGGGVAHFSPDGRRLFVVTSSYSISIRDIQSGSERTIKPQLKSWKAVKWSHDGAALLLLGSGADGKTGVYRVDDATGASGLMAELPEEVWNFAPSRDGKTIFFGGPRQTQARDLTSGAERTLFSAAPVGGNYDLRPSRDGRRLAIRGASCIVLVDLDSGSAREVFRDPGPELRPFWAMDWSADGRQLHTIVRAGSMSQMELWTFSVDGGAPTKRPVPADWRGLSFSADGKYVATTRLSKRGQLWAIENFLPTNK